LRFYEHGSDIWFGDFDDADFFHIEQTDFYQKRMKPYGIKSAEFLLLRSVAASNERKLLVIVEQGDGSSVWVFTEKCVRFDYEVECRAKVGRPSFRRRACIKARGSI